MLWLSFSYFTFGPIYHSLQSWLFFSGRANTRASEGAAKPRERLTLQSLARTEETAKLCYRTVQFSFCVILYLWAIFSEYKPPGGLYSEGRFTGGFFALRVCGVIFGGA